MKHWYDIVANQSNVLIAGANVTVFFTGTTNLAPLFSDDGITAKANPVVTDAQGRFDFYIADGRYDLQVSGANLSTIVQHSVEISDVTESAPSDANWQTAVIGFVQQAADPAVPAAGTIELYSKSSTKHIYIRDDAGVVTDLITPPAPPPTGIEIQVNGTDTASQTLLNLVAGSNVTITNPSGGIVQIASTGGGGGGGSPAGPQNSLQKNSSGSFGASSIVDNGTSIMVGETSAFRGPNPYFDIMAWGGYSNASPPSTTATCTSGSPNVTLASALDFQDATAFPGGVGNGIVLYKCGAPTALSTPPAPTVTPYGLINGGTSYNYQFVAEDTSGGLTAASAAGTTTTGQATLGIRPVSLTAATWNSTTNGQQVYTCSANCNVSNGAQISISGFTNQHFNGQYTIIATNGSNQFTVYSPATPAITSESAAATAKVLAVNLLTLPALSVPSTVEAGNGDTVIRWWVYRNNVLAFCVQARDPYYEDAGVNMNPAFIPSYVPSTPGVAVNKYLPTTLVSGGGTPNITVANNAGNSIGGVPALHDNSQNWLKLLAASRFVTPVYISQSNMPFNAATVITNSIGSATHTRLVGLTINQPIVLQSGGIVFEGLQNSTPAYAPMAVISGNAFPLFLYPDTPGQQGFKFKNVGFSANQLQQVPFNFEAEQSAFGLIFDNVAFASHNGNDNLNTPAAIFKGITESYIGVPGNKCVCSVPQQPVGPPCFRFTTVSTAIQSGQVAVAGDISINGFEILGGGSSYQFDTLPFINSGGNNNNVAGIIGIYISEGLREQGDGPFIRLVNPAQATSMWIRNISDDAPNALAGNAFVDAAYPGNGSIFFDINNILSSVGGQVLIAGVTTPANVRVTTEASPFPIGSTAPSLLAVGNTSTTGNIQAFGTSSIGYTLTTPLTPTAVAVAGATFAAGTYTVAISWSDAIGNQSLVSPATSVTTSGGNLNINVTPVGTPPPGAAGYVTYVNGLARDIVNGSCSNMVTVPPTATASPFANNCNGFGPSGTVAGSASSSSLSSMGLSSGVLTITPSAFAALPAAANGTLRYCSDCTIANPCVGGGTGAIAKRLNSVWVCN
jgi:hypothetical protein